MCGLAGAFSWKTSAAAPRESDVLAARDRMWRRGQDGQGLWTSADGRTILGHRRLAIIDLDGRSAQPLGRAGLQIVFNGEIYNYLQLRAELEAQGDQFVTEGDAEVILALYGREGARALHRLRGMFAIAIYDERKRELFLARDPYGIKPLYYSNVGGTFYFASQVKALRKIAAIPAEADPAGIVGFHLLGSVPEPFTLHRAISGLGAGHYLLVGENKAGEQVRYAHIAEELAGARRDGSGSIDAVVRDAALDSVAAHLVADVEVGLFLSGGVDSGALLGLMRDCGQQRIRAFTLAFEQLEGTASDEAPGSRIIARQFGADHQVEVVTAADFAGSVDQLLDDMDQPSVDGVNSWFVSRGAARAGLKVVLSGLGGDELLAGYDHFHRIPRSHRLARRAASLPLARPLLGWALKRFGPRLAPGHPKLCGFLDYAPDLAGAYLLHRAVLLPFELDRALDRETIGEGLERLDPIGQIRESITPDPGGDIARVSAMESANYMRNQLLRDSDWACMAHTLELRVPFVDWPTLRRIAPIIHRLGHRAGKRALAAAPSLPLPREIVERAKHGFTIPVAAWCNAAGAPDRLGSRHWGARVAASFAA